MALIKSLKIFISSMKYGSTVKPRFSEHQNSEKPLFSDRFKADQISVFVLCNLQNSEKPQFSQQIAADQTVH